MSRASTGRRRRGVRHSRTIRVSRPTRPPDLAFDDGHHVVEQQLARLQAGDPGGRLGRRHGRQDASSARRSPGPPARRTTSPPRRWPAGTSGVHPAPASSAAGPISRSVRDILRSGCRPTRSTVSGRYGLANLLQDLVDVGLLRLGCELVLVDQQLLGLGQHPLDLGPDHVVGQGIAEFADPSDEAVVRGGGVTGVDGEQLSLDVRSEIVDPGGVRNGRLVAAERWPLDRPFEVALDRDVESLAVGGLRRARSDRPRCWRRSPCCSGRAHSASSGDQRADELEQHIGGVDGVLAGHHDQRRRRRRPRPRSPATMTGATNRRMVGPTAVVTMSAVAISATTCGLFGAAVDGPVVVDRLPPRIAGRPP